jgi:hypothetical protein
VWFKSSSAVTATTETSDKLLSCCGRRLVLLLLVAGAVVAASVAAHRTPFLVIGIAMPARPLLAPGALVAIRISITARPPVSA